MHLIVGIDPGKTSAIACIDLSGKPVFITHKTFAGTEWMIDEIRKAGIPSVIACDREPHESVKKVAAAFNTRLFYPVKEMTVLEKRLSVKKFEITNPHERDACAAAIKAYNSYANKLKQAEHIARDKSREEIDQVKAKVIERYSINEALENRPANRK